MQLEALKYLYDIKTSAERVQRFVVGKNLEAPGGDIVGLVRLAALWTAPKINLRLQGAVYPGFAGARL